MPEPEAKAVLAELRGIREAIDGLREDGVAHNAARQRDVAMMMDKQMTALANARRFQLVSLSCSLLAIALVIWMLLRTGIFSHQ